MTLQYAIYSCHSTWFGGFRGLRFQTIRLSLLFWPPTCKTPVRFKIKLWCFSKLQIPPFLRRTLIPTRSTDQSPGGSVERSLLPRIMGFPSALAHQMLHQNGRHVSAELFAAGRTSMQLIYIVFKRICFEKHEPKITHCPAASYVWKDQQRRRGEVSSFFFYSCQFSLPTLIQSVSLHSWNLLKGK